LTTCSMKQVLWVFLGIALLTASCSTQNEADKNVALANAMFDVFNKHEWQKMCAFYSENALFLDPSFGPEYVTKTRQEISAKYAEMEKLFPDIHDHVVGSYPSGDKVTVEFVSTGTISDSLKFKLPIITVLTFKDGLIIKDATYYDQENP
jgi:ketosteroid isomerase-like protein